MSYLILLFVTELLLLYLSFSFCQKDILAPAVVMCGMFVVSTGFTLINARDWNIEYSFQAFFLLASGIFVFMIPNIVMQHLRLEYPVKISVCQHRSLTIQRCKQYAVMIFSIVYLYYYYGEVVRIASSAGGSGSNYLWYFRKAVSIDVSETINPIVNMGGKLLDATAYIFTYTLVHNVVIYKEKLSKNIFLTVPVITFIVKALLSSNRQEILKIVAFSIVISYILYHQKIGWDKNISLKYVKVAVLGMCIGLPLFYYASYLIGRGSTRTMFEVISTYVGGPIQHFNQYIESPPAKSSFWGKECFPGVLNLLGRLQIIDFHSSVHLEMRKLGITMGNIYTFFRRPIQDFGVPGMYLFTLTVGTIFARAYFFNVKYQAVEYRMDRTIILYAYFFYWIILSSTEQYSLGLLSISTVIMVILFYMLGWFYFKVTFKNGKIIFPIPKLRIRVMS